jgi:CDP-paratose synthetase
VSPTSAARPTVLLTGATGFLGSHLLRGLLRAKASVVVLKRSTSNPWRIADLLPEVVTFDVDRAPIRSAFEALPIDVVMHAATSYGRKGESVSEIIDSNVVFPTRLLELSAELGVKAFLNSDSFSTKGAAPPEGLAYYTLSKAHFRDYGGRLADENGVRLINLRLEHVYGPNDEPTKFVPSLIAALLRNQPTFELTAGEQLRDFVYVDDVVEAYLAVLDRFAVLPRDTTLLEVGSGTARPLREVVELTKELCASDTKLLFGALPYRGEELMESRADTRALELLGWRPRTSLRDGLERTVEASRSALASTTPGAGR